MKVLDGHLVSRYRHTMRTKIDNPRKWPTLPKDCFLSYVVSHEAWYGQIPNVIDRPSISIHAESVGGGVEWEFTVNEYDLSGKKAIRVGLFDDAFAAFAQIPWFFEALAKHEVKTLEQVRIALDAAGATDSTERERR